MTDERLAREASFHDHAHLSGARTAAAKFYAVTRASRRDYWDLISRDVAGMRILEYGCGTGTSAFDLARCGANVVGIDISPVRIDQARQRSSIEGLSDRLDFQVGDAEHLPFDDESFDRIVGGAILHHLDLGLAYPEIARVLNPGGFAAFVEPLGHNPAINWYRSRTPSMRTADEHPLLTSDIDAARRLFSSVRVGYYHLFALGVVPLRNTLLFRPALAIGEGLDRVVMRAVPRIRPLAWQAIIQLERKGG